MVVKSKRPTYDAAATSASIPPSIQPHPPLSPRLAVGSTPRPMVQGGIAMSKVETVLLSATGDVLVSRCRESSRPYTIPPRPTSRAKSGLQTDKDETDVLWCGLENLDQTSVLNFCGPDPDDVAIGHTRGGLLGGNPPKGETSDVPETDVRPKENGTTQESASDSLSSTIPVSPKPPMHADGDTMEEQLTPDRKSENLFPLPSFDYSHFADGGNDMIPGSDERARTKSAREPSEAVSPSYLAALLEGGETDELASLRADLSIPNGSGIPIKPPQEDDFNGGAKDSMYFGGDIDPVPSSIGRLRPAGSAISPPMVMHGVPIFLSSLSQISIKQVSAHPLGSHVLLISREALLFSYGLNDHGQLGNGRISSTEDENLGFVTSPTIVTPLLENGGKAVICAAGVDHSLVVVNTDGRRMSRLRGHNKNGGKHESLAEVSSVASSPPRIIGTDDESVDHSTTSSNSPDPSELIYHHQVYGFGRNNCMKLGLVNPAVKPLCPEDEDEEDVPLPRRVALHCSVWPGTSGGPAPGIFSICASEQHSAALVRRATGAVELYTWGYAGDGALGPHNLVDEMSSIDDICRKATPSADAQEGKELTMNGVCPKPHLTHNVGTPSVVRKLSYFPSSNEDWEQLQSLDGGDESLSTKTASSISPNEHVLGEYPSHVAVGPKSTFVVTSTGRCLSFGTSDDGLLGQGASVTKSTEPRSLQFPDSITNAGMEITSVSIGARHAVALGRDGSVYAWGASSGGRLGYRSSLKAGSLSDAAQTIADDIEWSPRSLDVRRSNRPGLKKIRNHRSVSESDLTHSMDSCRLNGTSAPAAKKALTIEPVRVPVVHACAGYDSTVLITASGTVLSCGVNSGRLGHGEVTSIVRSPMPMFGGLRLWQDKKS